MRGKTVRCCRRRSPQNEGSRRGGVGGGGGGDASVGASCARRAPRPAPKTRHRVRRRRNPRPLQTRASLIRWRRHDIRPRAPIAVDTMTKIVVFSLCLLLTIRLIACIDCFSCMSSENPDCVDPEKHLKQRKCDLDALRQTSEYASTLNSDFKQIFDFTPFEQVPRLSCLKSVVKVGSQEVVIRGCQLPKEPQPDVCTKMINNNNQKNNVQVMHCSLCDADGCNSAPPLARTTALVATLLLAALVVAY